MIKRVKVKNIQSHKESEIHFHPNVNLITGRSNSGKTAFIRSLLMLLTNRPLGDKWKSYWADKEPMQVECEVPNKVVNLIHGKKRSYKMDDEEYSGMKGDIPDDIRKVLNIGDLNIQRQFDQPFLVTSAPGEVARVINRIIQLEKVESWIKNLTSRINRNNRDASIHKEELERIKEHIQKLEWVEQADKDISEAEETEKEINEKQEQTMRLGSLINETRSIWANKLVLTEVIEGLTEGLEQCEKLVERVQRLLNEISILDLQKVIRFDMERIEKHLAVVPIVKEAEKILEVIISEQSEVEKLSTTINEISKTSDQIKRTFDDLNLLHEKLYNTVMSIRKCPTCGQDLSVDIVNHILEEL